MIFVWSNGFLMMEIFTFLYKILSIQENMNLIILLMEWWIDDAKNLYKFFSIWILSKFSYIFGYEIWKIWSVYNWTEFLGALFENEFHFKYSN